MGVPLVGQAADFPLIPEDAGLSLIGRSVRAARRISQGFAGLIAPQELPKEIPVGDVKGQRRHLSVYCSFEKVLSYGSCIPFVANICGPARLLYGCVIVVLGTAEIINKLAKAQFKPEETFFDKVVVLKGGSVPLVLKGVEHIIAGIFAPSSIIGNVMCLAYEILGKPYLPAGLSQEVTVDVEGIKELADRIKKHSAIQKVDDFFKELKHAIFNV